MAMTDEQIERYSRHIILKEVGAKGQKKLLNAKVLIIGAGGLGAPAAMYLAAAGVGTIGIVDADESIVEDDVVIIVEETHNKPLAMGIALITGPEMVENSEGKAIKSLHYDGDAIWNLEV